MGGRFYKKRNAPKKRRSTFAKRTKTARASSVAKRRTSTTSTLKRMADAATGNPSGRTPLVMYKNLLRPKVLTKLTYCDTKTITPGTGMANHVFSMNNLYDPDYTGVGHQPAFRDEWANIYGHYRVLAAHVRVSFRPVLTDANIQAQKQTHTGPSAETYPYILSQPQRNRVIHALEMSQDTSFRYTEAVDLNCLREGLYPPNTIKWSQGPNSTFNWNVDIRKHLFETSNFLNPAAVGSAPTDAVYMAVVAMSRDGGATNDVQFDIKIDYMVEFSNNTSNIQTS